MISPSMPMFLRNSRLALQLIITELSMLIGSYSNLLSLLKISSVLCKADCFQPALSIKSNRKTVLHHLRPVPPFLCLLPVKKIRLRILHFIILCPSFFCAGPLFYSVTAGRYTIGSIDFPSFFISKKRLLPSLT